MKITATMRSTSRVGDQRLDSKIERVAHESITTEIISASGLRVVVTVSEHGATLDTFRLAPGAAVDDRDQKIAWTEDASITLVADRPTVVTSTPETFWLPSEPLPF